MRKNKLSKLRSGNIRESKAKTVLQCLQRKGYSYKSKPQNIY